jgi:hypothetical protein
MKKLRFIIGIGIPGTGKSHILIYESSFHERVATSVIMREIDKYVQEFIDTNYFRVSWKYDFITQIIL